MRLDENVLQSFAMGRVFQTDDPAGARINSISFHRAHDFLVTASDDDVIRIYDTQAGEELPRRLLSKKYGCANITYTHDPYSVVASSNKGADYALRYHDLHENRYIRYFRGHMGRITTLSMSPSSDTFLSAAEDKTVRLWDLRVNGCQALLTAPGLPTTTYDEQGLVFAVGAERGVVKLFDARKWSQGPFTSFPVRDEIHSGALFACLKFSMDGGLLLAVAEGRIYILDSYDGTVKQKIVNPGVGEGGQALEACLTPDARFVLSGNPDTSIRAWSVGTGQEVARWDIHAGVPTCLKFSPRKMLFASACCALGLWIPDFSKLPQQEQQQPQQHQVSAFPVQQHQQQPPPMHQQQQQPMQQQQAMPPMQHQHQQHQQPPPMLHQQHQPGPPMHHPAPPHMHQQPPPMHQQQHQQQQGWHPQGQMPPPTHQPPPQHQQPPPHHAMYRQQPPPGWGGR